MSVIKAYLFFYNLISAVGWAYVLYLTSTTIFYQHQAGKNWENIATACWDTVSPTLKVVQSLAAMEIVHSGVGFVKSPLGSTVMQVSSRLGLVWAINVPCPPSRYQFGFPLMVLSWGIVEVPRYTFYAMNLIGQVPSFLLFLRYHLFMVLYPSGVAGEVLCMLSALPFLAKGVYSIQLPNPHNLALSAYMMVVLVLITYIPGLPIMYSHMLAQRNRAYAKLKSA